MAFIVPTEPDVPLYVQRVTLTDREYLMHFDYNQRENRIYLDISLPDGSYLVRGWKMVTGIPFGPRIADRRMFTGALLVVTDQADRSPPGLGELGSDRRCQLLYFTAEELAE